GAMDLLRRDPVRLLAGLGALSGARTRLQLRRGWRAGRLASQFHWFCGALEQELQPRPGFRCLVPESSAEAEAIPLQLRRLSHAQLHPDSRYDDPRADRRPVAAEIRAVDPHAPFSDIWRWRYRARARAAFHRCRAGGEAHLDSRLDHLQRRRLLPDAC